MCLYLSFKLTSRNSPLPRPAAVPQRQGMQLTGAEFTLILEESSFKTRCCCHMRLSSKP